MPVAGLPFIVWELAGKSESAADRPLGKRGAFLTIDQSPASYARFATKAEAIAAGQAATNRRPGSLLHAMKEV